MICWYVCLYHRVCCCRFVVQQLADHVGVHGVDEGASNMNTMLHLLPAATRAVLAIWWGSTTPHGYY
jgi:hypothetical protein